MRPLKQNGLIISFQVDRRNDFSSWPKLYTELPRSRGAKLFTAQAFGRGAEAPSFLPASKYIPSLPPPFPLRRSSSVRVATGMRLIDLNPTPMKWFRLSTQKMKKELCRVQCSAPSGVTNYLKTLIAVSWGSFNDHVAPTLVGHFQLTFHQLIFSRNIHRAPHDIQIHENSFRKWTITSLL